MSDHDDDEAGNQAVRDLLIQPLNDAGLKRPRGLSERAQKDALALLVRDLDHMSAENLRTLCDAVLRQATLPGPGQGHWPAAVLIIAWGHGLQIRPFRLHRLVTSWLSSIEGPKAEAGGWLVQLFRFLRQHKRPPTQFDLSEIRNQAREDNRHLTNVADWVARGTASEPDRQWHEGYLSDQQMARDFVDQGQAKRAAENKKQDGVAA
ncbi:MAG: hypothetical protein Q7V20_23115 [Aquabacterium sp.]|uniref:hypothetical protein n=1 Tax=Aquabacterium sp. TaxID=1872578 RepID=UPI00271D2B1C|nr:hypothetical protein [Aquabacterium sp.]MDO9006345.1 hypothetical protein [Aquabacterium sp.]